MIISLFPDLHTYLHCHFTFTKNDTFTQLLYGCFLPATFSVEKRVLIFISPGQLNRTSLGQTKPPRGILSYI